MSYPVSWTQLVDKLDDLDDDIDLLKLLMEIGDYSSFIGNIDKIKRVILENFLSDNSLLVDKIMEIVADQPTIDKILSYDITPSHRFKADERYDVLTTIFGFQPVKFPDVNRFMQSLSVRKTEFPEVTNNSSSFKCLSDYNVLDDCCLYEKEMSLTPKLALLAGSISFTLREVLHASVFVQFEFSFVPDKSYAIDGAVVSFVEESTTNRIPLILYELKCQVSANLVDQDFNSLSEFFIQAYYLASMYQHKFWHCLTDMKDFHYFQYQLKNGHLEVQHYHYLNADDFLLTDHQNHVMKVANLFVNYKDD